MASINATAPAIAHGVSAMDTAVTVRRWSILGLLTIGVIVAYIARVNLSVAVIDGGFKSFFQLTAMWTVFFLLPGIASYFFLVRRRTRRTEDLVGAHTSV
jgi:hypothetical protein